ncbi:hypothetical protein VCH24_64200 [Variovorax boronicumulans]|nr:hypothetical protein VCH24_64200 [Variovorax boronicumulans]
MRKGGADNPVDMPVSLGALGTFLFAKTLTRSPRFQSVGGLLVSHGKHIKGMYCLREGASAGKKPRVQLLGSGSILKEVLAAAELLEKDFGVTSDIWSVTSYSELRCEGLEVERWNRLYPTATARMSYVEQSFVNRSDAVLGTDGFGRSDTRESLRRFFEVDRHHIALTALKALADDGVVSHELAAQAIARYDIDPEAQSAALP